MKQKYKKKVRINLIELLPVVLFICLTPFIVYLKSSDFDMSIYDWYSDTTSFADFFTYYKSVFVMSITFITLFIYLYKSTTSKYHKVEKRQYYAPLLIYFAFMILSWVFSHYTRTATSGYIERFEGGLILTSYLLMFLYITQVIESEQQLKWIMKYFIISIILMNIIGFLQYVHLDYFRVEAIQKLLVPSRFENGTFKFAYDEGRVYMTLYHSNYVGLYLSMIFPICFTFFMCEKNWKRKLLWVSLTLLTLINLQGSQSRGGIIGIAFALALGAIFLRKKIFRYWKVLIPSFLVIIALFIGFDVMNNRFFSQRLIDTIKQVIDEPIDYDLNEIITHGNELHINYKDQPLDIYYEDHLKPTDTINYKDINGNVLELEFNANNNITFSTPEFQVYEFNYVLYQDQTHIQFLLDDGSTWLFTFTDEGFRYVNPYGKQVVLEDISHIGFEGKERTGSARGYIWSRSIPLLKDTLFIGYGPDCYIYEFPQNDYVGKYNAYHTANMIVDKPHNIYLQIAINTGIISLLAMIAFWGMYIFSSIKLYFKNDLNDYLSILGLALFLSVCGYLGAGFFNDTNVSISPIYWGIIGLGFVVNQLNKDKLKG
ncbi:O-antigen ligase family protein [Vallitalea okinawensis]|uniref:O-antigen ligase family protein n=1 Tax=Vallitalea okinawensis TaxID=2078660 RepID=UPI0013003F32|nr:O-antigen ligase family protein [Vallitalea okinawensis]